MKFFKSVLILLFSFALLYNCSTDSAKTTTNEIENRIKPTEKQNLVLKNLLKENWTTKISNIRNIELDLDEKKGFQYLYFIAEENGETKIFAQSTGNNYIKDFSIFNNLESGRTFTYEGTQHSCSGCSVCRFKKNGSGVIEGCQKYGNCTCIHTITEVQN